MGNCLVVQEKVVCRVIKTDGKLLEYKPPIKARQVLSEFPNHAISDKLPVVKHLHPYAELLQGHLYYLIPLPVPPSPIKKKEKKKKAVSFSDDASEDAGGVVRIKLLISKRELQATLGKEGVTIDQVISKVQNEESTKRGDSGDKSGDVISKGWSPALESIPEVN